MLLTTESDTCATRETCARNCVCNSKVRRRTSLRAFPALAWQALPENTEDCHREELDSKIGQVSQAQTSEVNYSDHNIILITFHAGFTMFSETIGSIRSSGAESCQLGQLVGAFSRPGPHCNDNTTPNMAMNLIGNPLEGGRCT